MSASNRRTRRSKSPEGFPRSDTKHETASRASESHSESQGGDESDSDSDSDSEAEDVTQRKDIPEHLRLQVDRLKALRERVARSSQDNKRDLLREHQRQHENPGEQRRQERKRKEARRLQLREEYTGDDYERSRFWDYSVEEVEKYEEKRRRREDNRERGFTDYTQVNQRKYERDVSKLKPNVAAYQRAKAAAAAAAAAGGGSGEPHKPDERSVERLVQSVEEQQKRRATLHKPSIEKDGEEVSYINQRNARFNRKMNRAYDKHTKEIRDSLERGTAL
ncbi:pre-mRNA-splicing factor SYF2 [Coemansia javaensis]|uniref:Pre-mRNA-splicing factor SYF2 n=1 Tax=Coemansia javaensis TaxID=2761396 RepID=A0A9W8LEP1_9FUNG|nr:pre-mRNA-splicing factor SYF2 [Coemansia javaensis]